VVPQDPLLSLCVAVLLLRALCHKKMQDRHGCIVKVRLRRKRRVGCGGIPLARQGRQRENMALLPDRRQVIRKDLPGRCETKDLIVS
jgi:hypothetical protein